VGQHEGATAAPVAAGEVAPPAELEALIDRALQEDIGRGDVTTEAIVPADLMAQAVMLAKAPGRIAGLPVAAAVFKRLDTRVRWEALVAEGTTVEEVPTAIARLSGPARAILSGERVALNLVQRLSGIATLAGRCAAAVEGTGARVLDTRKTTPGLRTLEKYAVRAGGGQNHRFGLYDGVLIKDNHIRAAGGIATAVAAVRGRVPPGLRVEVEARTLAEVAEAVASGAEIILLDNMTPALLREAVALVEGRALLEASGGVTLSTVRQVAETGVDYVSLGLLTHSAPALDISLDITHTEA
jgi:nicotinate-nucleotide pyrophosphorylase (carboxylating)